MVQSFPVEHKHNQSRFLLLLLFHKVKVNKEGMFAHGFSCPSLHLSSFINNNKNRKNDTLDTCNKFN